MKLLINLAILFLCCIGVSGQTYRKEIWAHPIYLGD